MDLGEGPPKNQVPFPHCKERPWDIKRPVRAHRAHPEPRSPNPQAKVLPLRGKDSTWSPHPPLLAAAEWLCHSVSPLPRHNCQSVGLSGISGKPGLQVAGHICMFPSQLSVSLSDSSVDKVLRPSQKVRFIQNDFL